MKAVLFCIFLSACGWHPNGKKSETTEVCFTRDDGELRCTSNEKEKQELAFESEVE